MQNGECPSGLAVLSLYDMIRKNGSTLFVIVIGQAFLATFHFLENFEGNQSSQPAENTKYHNTEHKSKRLSASPPCEEPVFSLAEGAVFTRRAEGQDDNIFALAGAARAKGGGPSRQLCAPLPETGPSYGRRAVFHRLLHLS